MCTWDKRLENAIIWSWTTCYFWFTSFFLGTSKYSVVWEDLILSNKFLIELCPILQMNPCFFSVIDCNLGSISISIHKDWCYLLSFFFKTDTDYFVMWMKHTLFKHVSIKTPPGCLTDNEHPVHNLHVKVWLFLRVNS